MIPSSYLAALLASAVYVIGFLAIHRLTAAKWFALEVLFGGLVGAVGLGLGLWLVPLFRIEYYVALFGVLWFCFFFVSGIFYASVSLAIVRYLSQKPGSSATAEEVYRDCIVTPFLDRAQFLARVGQATLSKGSSQQGHDALYCISPTGANNATRIRLIQRLFGFATAGYYSVPNQPEGVTTTVPEVAGKDSHQFIRIIFGVILALSLAETCVTHGVRETVRPGWTGITAVLVLGVAFFFAVHASINHLSNRASRDPSHWVLWMPLAVVLLLAQLAGLLDGGTRTTASDWVVLTATILVVVRGLWTTPIRALWPLFLVWIAGVTVWYMAGGTGMLHNELVDRYLPSYLTKRPWLDILFDPVIEFDDNRSRPVSLIFDFIDYRLVQASAQLGHPHFKMLTYPSFMLACTGTAYWFFVRDLKLGRSVALLVVMLFQSTPAVTFHTLYRSAKIGAALMVIVVFAMLYRFITAAEMGMKTRTRIPHLAAIGAGFMMMPMFDELGTYCICIGVASLSMYAIVRRTRIGWVLLGTASSTLAAAYVYRYAVSANLYAWVNGAALKSPYNINRALYDKIQFKTLLQTGTDLALDTFRFEFGNMSRAVVVAISLLLLIAYSWGFRVRWGRHVHATPLPLVAGIVLFGVLAMVVVQFCIMVHFHPPIGTYADVRRVYYALPTIALFMMIVAVSLKTVCAGHRNVARTVGVVLALCFVSNVDADRDHLKVIHSGHLTGFFSLSDETVRRILGVQSGTETSNPLVNRVLGR